MQAWLVWRRRVSMKPSAEEMSGERWYVISRSQSCNKAAAARNLPNGASPKMQKTSKKSREMLKVNSESKHDVSSNYAKMLNNNTYLLSRYKQLINENISMAK
jgi:hypothetical protein